MKKMQVLSLLFFLAMTLAFCEPGFSQTKNIDGFDKFYLRFRSIVNKRDRAGLQGVDANGVSLGDGWLSLTGGSIGKH